MAYHEIVWKPAYEIGVAEIDKQHQKLLEIANEFLKAKAEGKAQEVLKQTFVDLIDYTKYHFNAEEERMLKSNYSGLQQHNMEHKLLVDQIVQVLTHIQDGKAYAIEELSNLLKEWLVNHMIKEDKKFGDFLAKK